MTDGKSALPTLAERRAVESQSLRGFQALNLLHIRNSVGELLAQIGKNGLFEQYTIHDISHIDKMLQMLEWLVPESTQRVMTPADWLIVVLAIYFHDLGMVITRKEFDSRASSGYEAYRSSVYRGDQGEDYRAKVEKFSSSEESERFLYQEFVRHNHAERIKLWLTGQDSTQMGVSEDAAREVRKLVEPLGEKFCRDLGIVCESHHLEDLGDVKKYKPSQPYGDTSAETANLQYSALLLRTADLLHVTKDRTPSLSFRLINPTDPISVEEWLKQMAVVSVRSKVTLSKEGVADPSLSRDTVEVHAYFTNPGGFFALTRYLQYVKSELRKCHDWAKSGTKLTGVPHEFPWRNVDDSNVETAGFLSKQFGFTLDQAKILDLLTGHTLYNDIKVVLRELVQNSIDAVRLYALESGANPGSVHIAWDSKSRTLCVEDLGTGMSQRIIEEHLLKVGSSFYQDPEFQKKHPTFSPIRRFGIGVLSAFMIADEVEVITSHADDEQARQLTLRSVHGRYLVKLVDKNKLPEPVRSSGHGTIIKLVVRASVKMPDVLETARLWVLFPGCDVFVSTDAEAKTKIGFATTKEAVEAYYRQLAYGGDQNVKFVQVQRSGVDVAFAVEWSDYFQDWAFVVPHFQREEEAQKPPMGLCVEGIRVTLGTAGFSGFPIVAIANATGPNAPRTNVARSGLEATPQRDLALSAIYAALASHVTNEVRALHEARSFSLTWATKEAKFLVSCLIARTGEFRAEEPDLFLAEIAKIPALVVEHGGERHGISPAELGSSEKIWTIDCAFFDSAELVLKEVPGSTSLSALSGALIGGKVLLQSDPILCGYQYSHIFDLSALKGREVSEISLDRKQRRVDLLWCARGSSPRWRGITPQFPEWRHYSAQIQGAGSVLFGTEEIPLRGDVEGLTAVKAFGTTYILAGSPLAQCMNHYSQASISGKSKGAIFWVLTQMLHNFGSSATRSLIPGRELIGKHVQSATTRGPYSIADFKIDLEPLYLMWDQESWNIFDPSAWIRKSKSNTPEYELLYLSEEF